MCGRLAVADVQDDDGDENGEADEAHGEQEVLAKERHGQRRRRNDLWHEEEEHGLRQERRDAEGHFLARVGRQVEGQDGQARNAHARDDQIDRVEQRLPPQRNVEKDV